jgi:hypothetical protein
MPWAVEGRDARECNQKLHTYINDNLGQINEELKKPY